MDKKSMKRHTAITVLIVIIAGAVLLGFLFLNKGDGPVTGMILADRAVENTETYNTTAKTHDDGIYLVVSNAFNKFQEDYKADIPENNDLYVTVHFVECPQGSEYTGKWIKSGIVIHEENRTLPTWPEGVISYMLDGPSVVKGTYTFELYNGNGKIFEKTFSVE